MAKHIFHPLGDGPFRSGENTGAHQGRPDSDPRWYHMHGVDLMAPKGEARMPVYAVEDGALGAKDGNPKNLKKESEFQHSDKPGNAGTRMYLYAADGSEIYFYQHLESVAVNPKTGEPFKPGDKIEAGQLIGFTGAPASGGPHLHFALKNGDTDEFLASAPRQAPAITPPPASNSDVPECAPEEPNQSLPGDLPGADAALTFTPIDANFTPYDPALDQNIPIPDGPMSISEPVHSDPSSYMSVMPDSQVIHAADTFPDLGHPVDHSPGSTHSDSSPGGADGTWDGSPNATDHSDMGGSGANVQDQYHDAGPAIVGSDN